LRLAESLADDAATEAVPWSLRCWMLLVLLPVFCVPAPWLAAEPPLLLLLLLLLLGLALTMSANYMLLLVLLVM
jgi:hypothetical protein